MSDIEEDLRNAIQARDFNRVREILPYVKISDEYLRQAVNRGVPNWEVVELLYNSGGHPQIIFARAVEDRQIRLFDELMANPDVDPSANNNYALRIGKKDPYIRDRLMSDARVLRKFLNTPVPGVEVPYRYAICNSLVNIEYLRGLDSAGIAPEVFEKLDYEIPSWRNIQSGSLEDRTLQVVLRAIVKC